MTDTTPRLTVITPTGDYPVGDPRANEALAAYVRSKAVQRLTSNEKIQRLNAALAVVPQEGLCPTCYWAAIDLELSCDWLDDEAAS